MLIWELGTFMLNGKGLGCFFVMKHFSNTSEFNPTAGITVRCMPCVVR